LLPLKMTQKAACSGAASPQRCATSASYHDKVQHSFRWSCFGSNGHA
jgi:hypothetical protein